MTTTTPQPGAVNGLPNTFVFVSKNLSRRCTDALAGLNYIRETMLGMDDGAPLSEGLRDCIVALIAHNESCVVELAEHAEGSDRTWRNVPVEAAQGRAG